MFGRSKTSPATTAAGSDHPARAGAKNRPTPRDKGPIRRYIRDYVDARWNLGEFMLPVMILVLALSFVRQSWALTIVFVAVYGVIILAVGDAILMWRKVKKQLIAKISADLPQLIGDVVRPVAPGSSVHRRSRRPGAA